MDVHRSLKVGRRPLEHCFARCALISLAIAAALFAEPAVAQSTRGRTVKKAPPGRPRLARSVYQESPSPSGPQIPPGADQPYEEFGPVTPPTDTVAPLDEVIPESTTPPAANGGATSPAPLTMRQPEPEEELYEPFAPQRAIDEYEAAMSTPPNDFSKGAITQYAGPRDWYLDLSFGMYTRTRPDRVNFAFNTVTSSGQLFFVPIFGTEDVDYSAVAAGRATIGRGLWVDAKQRDHSLEFSYVGTNHWSEHFVLDRGGGATLISGFDVNGPSTPFDQADRYTLDSSSDMQSFELNYMIRRRLERDRLVYSPSGEWRREAYPGWRPAIGFGVRYLSFDDSFVYLSETTTGATRANGEYRIDARNSMVGGQVKGELMYQTWRWAMGVRGGATGCANFNEVHAFLAGETTSTAVADITPRTMSLREQDAGVIGELGVLMNFRITDRLTAHAGYDFIWLGAISLAPEQATYNTNVPAHLNNSGFVLVQGGTIGFELSW